MQVEDLQKLKFVSNKELESVLGRLEQVAIVIPMFGHFINNIRSLQINQINKSIMKKFQEMKKLIHR